MKRILATLTIALGLMFAGTAGPAQADPAADCDAECVAGLRAALDATTAMVQHLDSEAADARSTIIELTRVNTNLTLALRRSERRVRVLEVRLDKVWGQLGECSAR